MSKTNPQRSQDIVGVDSPPARSLPCSSSAVGSAGCLCGSFPTLCFYIIIISSSKIEDESGFYTFHFVLGLLKQ